MSPRIKLTQKIDHTRAEQLVTEIAQLTLRSQEIKIAIDLEITTIRERHAAELQEISTELKYRTELVESWAAQNPEEFPKNRKSIDLANGTVGYRKGTPKLKTILKYTWETILDLLAKQDLIKWLRIKTEVNKDAILSDYSQGLTTDAELRSLGIQVVQEESFFIEPRLQEMEVGK